MASKPPAEAPMPAIGKIFFPLLLEPVCVFLTFLFLLAQKNPLKTALLRLIFNQMDIAFWNSIFCPIMLLKVNKGMRLLCAIARASNVFHFQSLNLKRKISSISLASFYSFLTAISNPFNLVQPTNFGFHQV